MRLLIWGLFALTVSCLALLAWGGTALLEVLAPVLTQPPETWEKALAAWQPPAWLGWWVDLGGWEATRQLGLWTLEALAAAGPVVGALIGWVPVLIWGLWGLTSLGLLAVAVGAHMLVSRQGAGVAVAAGAARWMVGRKFGWGLAALEMLRRRG